MRKGFAHEMARDTIVRLLEEYKKECEIVSEGCVDYQVVFSEVEQLLSKYMGSVIMVVEESGVKYVVVAGYTAILFGRGRRSDDIDFIIEEIDEDVFVGICRRAWKAGFTLMQGDIGVEESVRRVYRSYLAEGYSVRFMYRDTVLPNVEINLARTEAHRYALDNSKSSDK